MAEAWPHPRQRIHLLASQAAAPAPPPALGRESIGSGSSAAVKPSPPVRGASRDDMQDGSASTRSITEFAHHPALEFRRSSFSCILSLNLGLFPSGHLPTRHPDHRALKLFRGHDTVPGGARMAPMRRTSHDA